MVTAAPSVVAAAQAYLERGFNLIAVRANKRPLRAGWRDEATPPVLLMADLRDPDCAAIGFPGGALNHRIVPLDFDTEAGEQWWRDGCVEAGIDPDDFPTVMTPGKKRADGERRPGRHRYVTDVRETLGNSQGELKPLGIDVRGKGHTVLPPSPHPDGGFYGWLPGHHFDNFSEIPPCPDFVYEAIAKRAEARAPNGAAPHGPSGGERVQKYCRAALTNERHRLAGVAEGARGSSLLEAARRLGRLWHYGAYSEGEAREALLAACEINGLLAKDGRKRCDATFASGWKYGSERPRDVAEGETATKRLRPGGGNAETPHENGHQTGPETNANIPPCGHADEPLVLDPTDPLPTARLFLDRLYTRDRLRTLHHHCDQFYAWTGTRYELADDQSIRAQLYDLLETAQRPARRKNAAIAFRPNSRKVSDVIDAVRAVSNVPSAKRPPTWLASIPNGCPPPAEILACSNCLLNLPTGELQPPTPAFFSLNSLDFAYDHAAPPPAAWLRFLSELWGSDAEAIETLQDWCGYCLTNDTRQQKIAMIVGPKRSGKGTIARVLTALLGQANVCGPTLASLGQNFGLAPLIGKQLAIISDARLGGRADQQAIAERLLSISGEDALTVDRKFLEPWTGCLPTRFLILTNELPRVADSSGAFASRFIVLTIQTSFYGREDLALTGRLLDELAGILKWAIAGWRRLQERGRLVQPASSAEAIRDLEDLSSPIGAFLRDRCDLGASCQVECATLFVAWCDWCKAANRDHTGTKQTFGRDLRAAIPWLRTAQPREGGTRERHYLGVSLKSSR